MDALTQQVLQQLSSNGISQVSKKIGVDEQTANAAMSVAMPLLVSALAKNASSPEGAKALNKSLAKDHDGSALDDVASVVQDPNALKADGILGHVLGSQQPVIAKGISKQTGLDEDQVGQVLQIAAPLIMGSLGKAQKQQGLDSEGLSTYLNQQHQQDKDDQPDLMGTLNSLLDMDKDGSALDDILGMAGKLFDNK
jgi:hypothetical protein